MKKRFLILALMLSLVLTVFYIDNSLAKEGSTYSVSGQVVDQNGNPVPDVKIQFGNSGDAVITDSDGRWNISDLEENITIIPDKTGWEFNLKTIDVSKSNDEIIIVGNNTPELIMQTFLQGVEKEDMKLIKEILVEDPTYVNFSSYDVQKLKEHYKSNNTEEVSEYFENDINQEYKSYVNNKNQLKEAYFEIVDKYKSNSEFLGKTTMNHIDKELFINNITYHAWVSDNRKFIINITSLNELKDSSIFKGQFTYSRKNEIRRAGIIEVTMRLEDNMWLISKVVEKFD